MFHSIFRKQFMLYMGVLLITILLLGTALSHALKDYFTRQKEEMLKDQGAKISSVYRKFVESYIAGFPDISAANEMNNQVQILCDYMDASFIFVDTSFTILQVSSNIDQAYIGGTLDIPGLSSVMNGEVVSTQGKITDLFNVPVLTVAYPVIIRDKIFGAIYMNSALSDLQRTISEAYRICLIWLTISAGIAFVLIYISSKTMSRPLLRMSEAARVITNGNFEKRIDVKSQDEVGQLAESFNIMAKSLDEQEKMRRDFISNISHDFRSPLTSMHGFLQAIQDGTIPPESQSRYIDIILEETERLSKLANDILDLNKLQSMKLSINCEDFDLNDLIRKTAHHVETYAAQKKIILNAIFTSETCVVTADYEKIHRVIYNLLDNAIKFTPEGGHVDVETSIRDKKVAVSVRDTGIGVAEEDRSKIFDRFYKADASRGDDKRGSGLGLAIVREFIRAHGEMVTLESQLGIGSEFIFTLPPAQRS